LLLNKYKEKNMKTVNINLSEEVFKEIEKKRGPKPHFRSGYIDQILREKFGIPQRNRGEK